MGKPRQSLFETDEDSLLPHNNNIEDELEEEIIETNNNNNIESNETHKTSNYNNDENYKIEVQNFVEAKEQKASVGIFKIAFFILC
eukprot:jgi/Orpsp1_1/1182337/evm.model.c7180000080874.1